MAEDKLYFVHEVPLGSRGEIVAFLTHIVTTNDGYRIECGSRATMEIESAVFEELGYRRAEHSA